MGKADTRSPNPIVPRDRRAFTLLELLVVIATIAVLIGILVPALTNSRRSGRGVACQSRMRTQGQAMHFYADANDSVVPLAETDYFHFTTVMLPGLGLTTMNLASEYFRLESNDDRYLDVLGDIVEFQCPEFPNDEQHLDFVVNAFLRPYVGDPAGEAGDGPQSNMTRLRTEYISLTRIDQSPSDVIYTVEAHAAMPTDTITLHDLFSADQLPFGAHPRIANTLRHPGGIHALFFDSHVERLLPQTIDVGSPNPLAGRLRYFTPLPG